MGLPLNSGRNPTGLISFFMASKSPFRIAAACLATLLGFAALHGKFAPATTAKAPPVSQAKPCALADDERLPWSGQSPAWRLQHVPHAQPGTYMEVSRFMTRSDWDALSPKFRTLAIRRLRDAQAGRMPVALCFAPGTDLTLVKAFRHMDSALSFFRLSTRWTSSATMASVPQGGPLILTWNLVPDGTPLPDEFSADPTATNPSNLESFAIQRFGSVENFKQKLRSIYARYEELTGIRYVEVNYDDGVETRDNPGVLGKRADIRIGGTAIDGDAGILAYDYFPNSSDMVLDTSDAYFTNTPTANNPNPDLLIRNTLAHEHGHGLGLMHTCPVDQTKLMEPFVSTNFDGPQLDDIQGVQHFYGDVNESPAVNNTTGSATNLGTLGVGTKALNMRSIGDVNDTDFFKLKTDAENRKLQVSLSLPGAPYLEGPQNDDGSCGAGTSFNPTNRRNLGLRLLNASGAVLATANAFPAGQGESFSISSLSGEGPFYIQVFASDNLDNPQLYNLNITLQAGNSSGAATVTGRCVSIFAGGDFASSQRIGLTGAKVTLKRASDGVALATATTDANGNYSIPKVSPGSYTLTASYDRDAATTVVMDPPSRSIQVDIADLPVPRFALYSIFGTIKAPNKQNVVTPVPSAVVRLINPKGVEIGNVTTGTDGRYEFKLQRAATFGLKTSKTNFIFPDKTIVTPGTDTNWSPATRANVLGSRAASGETVTGPSGHSS